MATVEMDSADEFTTVVFLPDGKEVKGKLPKMALAILQRPKLNAHGLAAEVSIQPKEKIDSGITSSEESLADAVVPDLIGDIAVTADPEDYLADAYLPGFINDSDQAPVLEVIEMSAVITQPDDLTDAIVPRNPLIFIPAVDTDSTGTENNEDDEIVSEKLVCVPFLPEPAAEAPSFHADSPRDPESNISEREARYLRLRNAFQHWQLVDYCGPYYDFMYMIIGISFGLCLLGFLALLMYNSVTYSSAISSYQTRIDELEQQCKNQGQIVQLLKRLFPNVYENVSEIANSGMLQ